jgi:hypothetical protein
MYYSTNTEMKDDSISTANARNLIIDYFKQTQPVIQEVLEEYLMRYDVYDNMHSMGVDGPYKNTLEKDIEVLLIKDFVSKHLINTISKKNPQAILKYLNQFVQENALTLEKIYAQDSYSNNSDILGTQLYPNRFLGQYEQALQNTLQAMEANKDMKERDNIWVQVSYRKEIPDHLVEHL